VPRFRYIIKSGWTFTITVGKPVKRAISAIAIVALVAGCSTPTSQRYDSGDVGRPIETTQGAVISSRVVEISGDTKNVGPIAGGAAGAAATGLAYGGRGSGWAAILGGLVGAGAGYLIESSARSREGIEYIVRMNDGRTVTLVQNRQKEEQPIADGTPVLVQISGRYTRVIPDPSADRATAGTAGAGGAGPAGAAGSSGGWVDPDTVTVAPDRSAPPPPGAPPQPPAQ
jgi:outer membrane lipoprotein SlyB